MRDNNRSKIVCILIFTVLVITEIIFIGSVSAFDFLYDFGFGGKGIGKKKFDFPVDIALDSDNNIYVLDQGNARVQKFDEDGEYITEWGKEGARPGEFEKPTSIYIDSNDTIYVVDSMNHRIQRFNTSGAFINSFGSLGSRYERFKAPNDMTYGRHNNIYVTDTKNNRIQKFSSSWSFKTEWGKTGKEEDKIVSPSSITYVDYKFGYLYVTSFSNCIVKRFDDDGSYDSEFVLKPGDVDPDIDEEKVVEDTNDTETEEADEENSDEDVDEKGEEEASGGDSGNIAACGIKRLIVDKIATDKYIIIIFVDFNEIFVYDYEGNYVDVLKEGKFKFNNPTAVYIKDRDLYVVDGGNNFIHKFEKR